MFFTELSLQEAHGSSRLRGFRVRTFAVTAAPPKRPFWQLWRPPKALSRGEACFPAAGSLKRTRGPLEESQNSTIKLGILLINSLCGTKANGPFSAKSWPGGFLEPRHLHLLLRCLQEAHRSSRLRGFRVRTFAMTAAPPQTAILAALKASKSIFTRRKVFST